MPPVGGARFAKRILMTSVSDPDDVKVYNSLASAARAAGLNGHNAMFRAIDKGAVVNGYKVAYVEPGVVVPVEPTALPIGIREFTFFDEVDELFRGQKIRYTEDEPVLVSVLDIIRVMTDSPQPKVVWVRLQEQFAELVTGVKLFQFGGPGRMTPVAPVATIIEIINVLPGERAARFRRAGAKVLVRFLNGDESLVDEIHANHDRMDQRVQHAVTTGQLDPMTAFRFPVGTGSNAHRSILFSPSMQGKTAACFKGPCTYLILFKHNENLAIKFGSSKDFRRRVKDHERTYKEMKIWSIHDCKTMDHASKTEQLFKDKMLAYLHTVHMCDGSVACEVLLNVPPETAEEQMQAAYHEVCAQYGDDNALEFKRIELRLMELQVAKAQHEVARLDRLLLLRQMGVMQTEVPV
jgi:hypothetical protein